MATTAGYDVGGAHLKVALAENGRTIAVRQIACPLWKGLEALDAAFAEAEPLTARADRHAVTMTGELCELFPDRRTGVRGILERLETILPPGIRIWMGAARLRQPRRGACRSDERRLDQLSRQRNARREEAHRRAAHRHGLDDDGHHRHCRRQAGSPRRHRRREAGDGRARLHRPHAHRCQRRRPAGDLPRAGATAGRRRLCQHGRRRAASSARCRPTSTSMRRSTAAVPRCRKASRASPAASAAMPPTPRPRTGVPAPARLPIGRSPRFAPPSRGAVGIGTAGGRADRRCRDRRCGNSGSRDQPRAPSVVSARWPLPRPTARNGRRAARPPSPSPCWRSRSAVILGLMLEACLRHDPRTHVSTRSARRNLHGATNASNGGTRVELDPRNKSEDDI